MKLRTSLATLFGILLFVFAQYSQAAQSGQTILKIVVEPIGISPAFDQAVAIIPDAAPSTSISASSTSQRPSSGVVTAASSGAWANNGGGPTIYSKNLWYGLILYPVGTIPSNATITSVSWSYGVSYRPSGFVVQLCHNGSVQYCGEITAWGSGSTNYFNTRAANQPMAFYFGVAGTGTLYPPVYGQNDSIIVNWTAP